MGMPRRLRFIPQRPMVEVTARTVQGRFLLKPVAGFRETFVGVLARAQLRYPVDVHAFVCTSNHFHLLVTPASAQQLAAFMCYVSSNLSREAGRLHGWRGPLFVRRYQAIVVSDEEEAQVGRLRYLLANTVKESLVWRARDWPGPHCAAALISGEPAKGIWYDRTREHIARHRGEEVSPSDVVIPYSLTLAPLPCWRHLPPGAVAKLVAQIVDDIESEAEAAHRRNGTRPLGVAAILRQDPHGQPRHSDWSPAPLVHAASKIARDQLRAAYFSFVAAFRAAAARLRRGCRDAVFPPGCFPPALPFCRGA